MSDGTTIYIKDNVVCFDADDWEEQKFLADTTETNVRYFIKCGKVLTEEERSEFVENVRIETENYERWENTKSYIIEANAHIMMHVEADSEDSAKRYVIDTIENMPMQAVAIDIDKKSITITKIEGSDEDK